MQKHVCLILKKFHHAILRVSPNDEKEYEISLEID